MSFVGYFTVVGALGFVLVVLGIAFRLLRRLSGVAGESRARLPLEVVQRLALGPKQGIAVVRVGSRVVAVSVGEGGIRPLLEVAEEDRAALLIGAPGAVYRPGAELSDSASPEGVSLPPDTGARPRLPRPKFGAALRTALRSYVTMAIIAAAAGGSLPSSAFAQAGGIRGGIGGSFSEPTAPVTPSAGYVAQADTMISRLAPEIDLRIGERGEGGLRLSGTVGVVVMMGLLTLLPTLLLMMTSFTRILIVLHFLRQALGTQSAPPAHLMAALALLLTGFVMAPTFSQVNETALQPWMNGEIEQGEMLSVGAVPLREFMLDQTRERDLATFAEMHQDAAVSNADDLPLVVVMSAFVTSELRKAFQIGFALFLPFIVIDVVVAAVLMSMGMFMLPPAMISLPFKLLLFVLVDGWSLIVQGLVSSFA